MGLFDLLKTPPSPSTMHGLLTLMKQKNGAELRLTPGAVPQALVNGRLLPLSALPLEPEETRTLCCCLFTEKEAAEFEKNNKVEVPFGVKGLSRYRAKIVSVDGKVSGVITVVVPPRT